MNSLLLISSLVLSSPVSIGNMPTTTDIDGFIVEQMEKVQKQVEYKNTIAVSDTFLSQARLATKLARTQIQMNAYLQNKSE